MLPQHSQEILLIRSEKCNDLLVTDGLSKIKCRRGIRALLEQKLHYGCVATVDGTLKRRRTWRKWWQRGLACGVKHSVQECVHASRLD